MSATKFPATTFKSWKTQIADVRANTSNCNLLQSIVKPNHTEFELKYRMIFTVEELDQLITSPRLMACVL